MTIKICGVHVFYRAIEAMWFDEEKQDLVVRTISGVEHRSFRETKQDADQSINLIKQGADINSRL